VLDHKFCVAPMMGYTDRHARYFYRTLSDRAVLYTEMVVARALWHGDKTRFLAHDQTEHPVALQLGGSDQKELAWAAKEAKAAGFDEVNLNVGCPSDRVKRGGIGACLMATPALVAECVAAMTDAGLPITVKTRIGIDHLDEYQHLAGFIETVAAAGCQTFIVHARKAWLNGLSPKDNRKIPPLDYDRVYRLKQDFSHLTIVINGGIPDIQAGANHLPQVDGVMLGRAIVDDPYLLAQVDQALYRQTTPMPSRTECASRMLPYVERERSRGTRLALLVKPLLGLFRGQPGARDFRRHLSEHAHRRDAGPEVLEAALRHLA